MSADLSPSAGSRVAALAALSGGLLGALTLAPPAAKGAGGTWTNDASGLWSQAARWSAGIVADGVDALADFSTVNITANRTVTLDSPRTVGSLRFGDTAVSHTWTLNGTNTLTLDVTAGAPAITVVNSSATISLPVAGTRGLAKDGLGTLTLSGANTFSGGLTLAGGALFITSDTNLGDAANDITVLASSRLTASGFATARDISIQAGAVLTNSVSVSLTLNGTISGGGTLRKTDTGVLTLDGTNTYGRTEIAAGELRAVDGIGMPGGNVNILGGGVWASSANITRAPGPGTNEVQLTGDAGFSAYGGPIEVNLGGAGAEVTWGVAPFDSPNPLYLNSANANAGLAFRNATDLNGTTRWITVGADVAEVSGIIRNSIGLAGLTKTGSGVLWLTATNTFNGALTVNGAVGTLRARDGVGIPSGININLTQDGIWETDQDITRAVGTGAGQIQLTGSGGGDGFSAHGAAISVNLGGAGATLAWGGSAAFNPPALVLNERSADHALTFVNGLDLNDGVRTIKANSTNCPGIISGVIGHSTGNSRLVKSGPGTIILTATNTWTHTSPDATNLNITAGAIQIEKEENLSGTPAAFMVKCLRLDGGTLRTTATFSIDDGNRGIFLGPGDGWFDVADGTTLTIANQIAGTAGDLRKRGAGTLALSHPANAYGTSTVGTHIEEGTLAISHDGNLGAASADLYFDGDTTLRATATATLDSGRAVAIAAGRTATIDVAGAVELTLAGATAGGSGALTKIGDGTLILSAVNAHDGLTTIRSGILRCGVANAFGTATDGDIEIASEGTLDVGGVSIAPDGMMYGSGTVDNSSGIGTLTVGARNGSATFDGVIRNTGGALNLTKNGSGTLTLTNPTNSYGGTTTVDAGTLQLGAAEVIPNGAGKGNVALTGGGDTLDLNGFSETINGLTGAGTVTNSAGEAVLALGDGDASAAATALIRDGGGTLALTKIGGGSQTLGGVISCRGAITVNAGTLVLSAANTYTNATVVNAGGRLKLGVAAGIPGGAGRGDVTVDGTLDLNALSPTINGLFGAGTVDNLSGTATYTLTVGGNHASGAFSGVIGNASGTVAVAKTGAGTLTLTGDNSYKGATAIGAGGALRIGHANALGAVGAGTTVSSGGALQIQGGIAAAAEPLTLNGTGVAGDGALRNVAGDNAFGGPVTLAGATRINSDAGTLTLDAAAGNALSGAFGVTFGGNGHVTVADPIATAAGTLTKDGSGTLTLLATNTYAGLTTIQAGAINARCAGALGTAAAGTVVNDGAALQLQGGAAIGAEALTLNGAGVAGDGALRSVSGNNSCGGALTLASASRIQGDADSLTLAGTIAGAGRDLTVGGAGNVVVSGAIATASGSLAKDGSGTLTLATPCTYAGGTRIDRGTLVAGNAAGSATGTGPVSVNGGGTLTGGGTIAGAVSVGDGGTLAPGAAGVGTLTAGGLALNPGCTNVFEFGTPPANDRIVVTAADGLTLGGGGCLLYAAGTADAWATDGIYTLIRYSGAPGGDAANLSVLNPDPSKAYTFSAVGGWVRLQISSSVVGPPTVSNGGGATNLTAHSVTLQGFLASTGALPTTVSIYWGPADGDTNASAWAHTNHFGQLGEEAFATNLPNWLAAGTTYYYRCYATNASGDDWADATAVFTTLSADAPAVAIASNLHDATSEFSPSPCAVFLNDAVGYVFYVEGPPGAGGSVAYRKTGDGGRSWGGAVSLGDDQDAGNVAVWYDPWTPGGSGSKIHIAHIGGAGADLTYNFLDTADDSTGAWITVTNGYQWTGAGGPYGGVAITRATTGRLFLYTAVRLSASVYVGGVQYSDDGMAWTKADPADSSGSAIYGQLLPLPGGDVLLIEQRAAAVDRFRHAVFSGGAWSDWTTNAVWLNATGYYSTWGASQDPRDGSVYLVAVTNAAGAAGRNLAAYRFDPGARAWSALGNVIEGTATNVTCATALADENSGDVYALYGRQEDGAIGSDPTNVAVRCKRTTDGGATWSAETEPLNPAGQDVRIVRGNLVSDQRLYALWYEEDLNQLFGQTLADLSPLGLRISDAQVLEGDADATSMVFTVSMVQPNEEDVTVCFETADGTAAAGPDYTSRRGVLVLPAGQTSTQITVVIAGDLIFEGSEPETFFVRLSSAVNAPLSKDVGVGRIQENEPFPNRYCVKAGAAGLGTGFNWDDAFVSLSQALKSVSAGDIWVCAGIYVPETSFAPQAGVRLYGGFDGTETDLAQRDFRARVTILSGDVNGDDVPGDVFSNRADNRARILTATNDLVIDGFRLTGANSGAADGAICVNKVADVVIRNCTFVDNYCSGTYAAGGITKIGNDPRPNVYPLTVENCAFFNNHGLNGSGALAIQNDYSGTFVTNCVFSGNTGNQGGAVGCYHFHVTLVNCTFMNNTATSGKGHSICTGWGEYWCGFTARNCIFWGRDTGEIWLDDTRDDLYFQNCCLPGGVPDGISISYPGTEWTITDLGGNIADDPLFIDAKGADGVAGTLDDVLRLATGSPCIDAGTGYLAPDADIRGVSRPLGDGHDIGAYEYEGGGETWSGALLIVR